MIDAITEMAKRGRRTQGEVIFEQAWAKQMGMECCAEERKKGVRDSGTFSDPDLKNWTLVQDWETVQEEANTSSWRAPYSKSRTVFD